MATTLIKTFEKETQLAALKFMAETLKITPQAHHLEGFAEACYDQNTVSELVDGLRTRAADKGDCQSWEITPTQWRDAIREAIERLLYNAIEDIEE